MTTQELAVRILEIIEQNEQEITGIDPFSLNYLHKITNMRSAIKELCQEEVNKQ